MRDLPRPAADAHVVCVVEQPRDVMALEAAGVFQGLYHVLQGASRRWKEIGPEI